MDKNVNVLQGCKNRTEQNRHFIRLIHKYIVLTHININNNNMSRSYTHTLKLHIFLQ